MTDPDRHYERYDAEPLRMDGRGHDRPRGPAPVTLIVSLLLLAAIGGGVFYMYRSGARRANDAPEPLGIPLRDVRAPAPPQAQTPDPTAGLTIARDDPNAVTGPPTLAPPPEQPLPPQAGAASSVPPAQAAAGLTVQSGPPPINAIPRPATTAAPRATSPSSPAVPNGTTTADKSETIDHLLAKPTAGKSASDSVRAKTASTPAAAGVAKTASATRVTRPDEAKPAPAAALGSGPVVVQIGAFSSQSLADKEWSKAAAVAPGAMAGRGKRVAPVTKDGVTLYRTAITGFDSRDQAVALCEKLKASGGTCFVH